MQWISPHRIFHRWMEALKICQKLSRKSSALVIFLVFSVLRAYPSAAQGGWRTLGPDGGDARSFASVPDHPRHLYLGTANSTIFESLDGGASWKRLARLDRDDDLVIAHIVVDRADSSRILVAAWRFDRPEGGLYVSRDGGHNWSVAPGLKNQSVFALVQAPSDSKIFVAGTLEGVFRSVDRGVTWELISPRGSKEIHEVESLAIHPLNPDIIYAGTWHLPWKTSDGGENWANIKQGVIDDSDVFSIIIDPDHPSTVYASACSGIYKSESAGKAFHKIQGIPATARRTRKLMQDPENLETVYAGTTEGLYKTTDGGKVFQRMTGPDVIVNDVWIDPENPSRVLLATDRSGVLASDDAAVTFNSSNRGFSARKVEALLVDSHDHGTIYAGVVNDKTYGGVFVSADGGREWKQIADGLGGRDIFALAQTQDGTIVAGTNSGIFVFDKDTNTWVPHNTLVNTIAHPVTQVLHGKHVTTVKTDEDKRELTSRVNGLDVSTDVWVAAAEGGIFTSRDQGATWQGGPAAGTGDYRAVTVHGNAMVAAHPGGLALSTDEGQTWMPMGVPATVTLIYRAVFSADGTLWLGAREGLYFSRDKGKNWMWLKRLPLVDVNGLFYDRQNDRVLASSRGSDFVYLIDTRSLSWTWQKTGFPVILVRSAAGRLIAVSPGSGVLVTELATEEASGGGAISTKTAQ
jgi:photosystem II stability/assembly factor-like uncharacterized protein